MEILCFIPLSCAQDIDTYLWYFGGEWKGDNWLQQPVSDAVLLQILMHLQACSTVLVV